MRPPPTYASILAPGAAPAEPPLALVVAAAAHAALVSGLGALGDAEMRAAYECAGLPYTNGGGGGGYVGAHVATLRRHARGFSEAAADAWVASGCVDGGGGGGDGVRAAATETATAAAALLLAGASRATQGLLICELLRLPRVDPAGGAQAAADAEFLNGSVLEALGGGGAEPDPLLRRVTYLLSAPAPALAALAAASGVALSAGAAAAAAERRAARADGGADGDAPGARPLSSDAGEATLRRLIAKARGLLPLGAAVK